MKTRGQLLELQNESRAYSLNNPPPPQHRELFVKFDEESYNLTHRKDPLVISLVSVKHYDSLIADVGISCIGPRIQRAFTIISYKPDGKIYLGGIIRLTPKILDSGVTGYTWPDGPGEPQIEPIFEISGSKDSMDSFYSSDAPHLAFMGY